MNVTKVISYKNAWEDLIQNHKTELNEIVQSLNEFFPEYLNAVKGNLNRYTSSREIWERKLEEKIGLSLIEALQQQLGNV